MCRLRGGRKGGARSWRMARERERGGRKVSFDGAKVFFPRKGVLGVGMVGEGGGEMVTGSKMPAPGQTISAPPNSLLATSNRRSRCRQLVTSVCWNTALASDGEPRECLETSSSASGRSFRSAKITLQRLCNRALANARLMPGKSVSIHLSWESVLPEPAPVTMAVLPASERAIALRGIF